jgi:hypothetical protein
MRTAPRTGQEADQCRRVANARKTGAGILKREIAAAKRECGRHFRGDRVRVFDARTRANLGAMAIIAPDGFPSSRIARGVTFSTNGAAITFDDCPRDRSGCTAGMVAIKP